MTYLGPVVKTELKASARSNGFGYKAVVVHRSLAPNGVWHERTTVISRTLKTREEALERAQRRVDFLNERGA